MGAGLNGIIFDDLEWPITQVSMSRYIYKSNISKTVHPVDIVTIENHTQSIEWCHFQWPWVTSNPDFKVTTFFDIEYLRNDTREP